MPDIDRRPRGATSAGSLVVVGTGIQLGGQITVAARNAIAAADLVLYFAADGHTARWIESLNRSARNLGELYAPGRPRRVTYELAVEEILGEVRAGTRVCAVFYGHPGVFAFPSHEAIRRSRSEGIAASMLPGVSAEDCLFADAGIDPGEFGCQSYDATDFVLRPRKFDTRSLLVLWQIGVIGDASMGGPTPRVGGVRVLVDVLCRHYPAEHETLIYEASLYAACPSRLERATLGELASTAFHPMATLVVPPFGEAEEDAHLRQLLEG